MATIATAAAVKAELMKSSKMDHRASDAAGGGIGACISGRGVAG